MGPRGAAPPGPSPRIARGLLCAGHRGHADFILAAVVPPAVLDAAVLGLHAEGGRGQRAGEAFTGGETEAGVRSFRALTSLQSRPGEGSVASLRGYFEGEEGLPGGGADLFTAAPHLASKVAKTQWSSPLPRVTGEEAKQEFQPREAEVRQALPQECERLISTRPTPWGPPSTAAATLEAALAGPCWARQPA